MKFRTAYNPGSNEAYFYKSKAPSLTSQKFKDRVALDRIVDMSTGELVIKDESAFLDLYDESKVMHSFQSKNSSLFDCTVGNDFTTLSNMYANAKSEFQSLPSQVRRYYHDDVNEFLDKIVQKKQSQSIVPSTPPPAENAQKPVSEATSAGDGEKSE